MPGERVAITGLGAVTPVGLDAESTWESFVAGRSGLSAVTGFDREAFGVETCVAAEIRDFDPGDYFDKRTWRRLDRAGQFALVSAREALDDAGLMDEDGGLSASEHDADRVGVFIASGVGGVSTLLCEEEAMRARGARRVSPFLLPMFLADAVGGAVAIRFGLRGPNIAHLSACASSANSIGEAFEAIRRGDVDIMLAGGSEACIVPVIVAAFNNMGALSKWCGEPALASRPFDAERDGFVVGEGAATLVLERMSYARARGANIRAELLGYGCTADAAHITAPVEDGAGMAKAIRGALHEADLSPDDIDYVNAHGTSTQLNDEVETRAVKSVFGQSAIDVPVSSVKSMIGHLLGAGGAVEALATVRTLETGVVPPTINLHTPDPECDLDYVPHEARKMGKGVRVAVSNSMGFGGHNVALVFGRA